MICLDVLGHSIVALWANCHLLTWKNICYHGKTNAKQRCQAPMTNINGASCNNWDAPPLFYGKWLLIPFKDLDSVIGRIFLFRLPLWICHVSVTSCPSSGGLHGFCRLYKAIYFKPYTCLRHWFCNDSRTGYHLNGPVAPNEFQLDLGNIFSKVVFTGTLL